MDAAGYVTLDTEQLISCTRAAFVDTIASVQSSKEAVLQCQMCMNFLGQLHDILDSDVSI